MSRRFAAIVLAMLTLTFAACSADAPRQTVVLIIRHAEKPDDGPGLTSRGEDRAKAYAHYFHDFKVDGKKLKLDAIYATADSAESQRPRLTVAPLAKSEGLNPKMLFTNKQVAELTDEIRSKHPGKHVLVCWHHGEIPELLQAFGVDPKSVLPDGKWPAQVFDWAIELRLDANGKVLRKRTKLIAERLLPGDSK